MSPVVALYGYWLTSTVPTYDARNTDFDIAHNLLLYIRKLPPFVGEIPTGSLVVVMYAANTYQKKVGSVKASDKTLSLNVQAVIVLGPDGSN